MFSRLPKGTRVSPGFQVRSGPGFRIGGSRLVGLPGRVRPELRENFPVRVFYGMDKHTMLDCNEIWKASFTLACRIYRITDQSPFARNPVVRAEIRKSMVRVLSSVIEGWESGEGPDAEDFLKQAVLSLGELRDRLLEGYQENCLTFQEFCEVREQCRRLRERMLDPRLEAVGAATG